MSHYNESTTSTPPISAEERQRREMKATIDRAINAANIQHQNEMNRLQQEHNAERDSLNQRLNAMDSRYSDAMRQHQRNLNQMRQSYDMQLQQTIADQTARRQQALRQQQQYFDSQFQRQEAQHRHDMDELQRTFDYALEEEAARREQLRMDMQDQLDTVEDNLNASIDNLRSDTQFAINQVNQNIMSLAQETQYAFNDVNQSIQSLAEETQQSLDDIRDDIDIIFNAIDEAHEKRMELHKAYNDQLSIVQMKNCEKFAPGKLQTIQAKLNGVDALPDAGACAVLNTAFNELLIMDRDIEQARMEYEAKHLITLKSIDEVILTMDGNKNIPFTIDNEVIEDADGNAVLVDVDFWSESKFMPLVEELKGIKETVLKGFDNPNYKTVELDKALARCIEINEEQKALVMNAIETCNASQRRLEMADCIADYLFATRRFRVIKQGFEVNDARKAYILTLYDGVSKLVVVLNPLSNGQDKIVIGTGETNLSVKELNQQGMEVNETLKNYMEIQTTEQACHISNQEMENAFKAIYNMDFVEKEIPAQLKQAAKL